jgi:hypothetical protein
MFKIIFSLFYSIRQGLWSRAALHAEILALRQQLLVLQRSKRSHKVQLGVADRIFWAWLSQLWNGWRSALVIVKPETVIAWHRRGFRLLFLLKTPYSLTQLNLRGFIARVPSTCSRSFSRCSLQSDKVFGVEPRSKQRSSPFDINSRSCSAPVALTSCA